MVFKFKGFVTIEYWNYLKQPVELSHSICSPLEPLLPGLSWSLCGRQNLLKAMFDLLNAKARFFFYPNCLCYISNKLKEMERWADFAVESRPYLDIAISKGGPTPKVVSTGNVTIEGCRVELGEDVDFVDPTVDAVAHWHIDQPVCSPYWDLQWRKFPIGNHVFCSATSCT